jgi:hypothetical protein
MGTERLSDTAKPRAEDAATIRSADLVEPRQMSEAQARELVPPSLRERLTITVDPGQAPGTVKVERVMRLGVVVDVKLVVGPNVRPIDVIMHGDTVHAMKRYVGVSGTIVRALERARSIIARDGMPPFGTKAWESWHELKKLPGIVEHRLEMLRTGTLDPHAEAAIHADIERLSRQVDEHRATFERMDKSPGAGYVAQLGEIPKAPSKVEGERPSTRAERGRADLQRFLAEGSALRKKYPNADFLQVGHSWSEAKVDGSRTYRVLEVRDPVTEQVILRREEILQIGPDGKERWVQRGSEANVTGEAGEVAHRLEFEAQQDFIGPKREMLLPPDVIQQPGGQGFDGVILRFEGDRVTIVLVEVKNYPGRYVPLADITAIKDNLNQNLQRLREMMGSKTDRERLGPLSSRRLRFESRQENRLEFELRHGDTTGGPSTVNEP